MPSYTFDVHDNGPVEWGDAILENAGRDDIERCARQLIDKAQERQHDRGDTPLTTVFVHQDGNGIILTAYGQPGQDVRIVWTPG